MHTPNDLGAIKCFYSVQEIAKILDMHPNSIRNAIKRGSISALKLTNEPKSRYKIPYTEIERLAVMHLEKVKKRKRKENL